VNKPTIIGTLDTETNRIGLAKTKITRPAQLDDIILFDGEFHRMIWNHNGQRLTSQNVSELVMAAWAKSEGGL